MLNWFYLMIHGKEMFIFKLNIVHPNFNEKLIVVLLHLCIIDAVLQYIILQNVQFGFGTSITHSKKQKNFNINLKAEGSNSRIGNIEVKAGVLPRKVYFFKSLVEKYEYRLRLFRSLLPSR